MIFSVSICSVASRRDLVTRQMAMGPRSRQMLDRGPTLTNEISARARMSIWKATTRRDKWRHAGPTSYGATNCLTIFSGDEYCIEPGLI